MLSTAARGIGLPVVAAITWAADKVVTGGTDWVGIGSVIGGVGGVITAIGTLLLGWRRKDDNDRFEQQQELIDMLLERELERRAPKKRAPRKREP